MAIDIDLLGQTALVTGASRGIGQAISVALAQAGANIIGTNTNSGSGPNKTAKLVQTTGRKFLSEVCDFSDRKQTLSFASRMAERGDISILINNAGTIRRAPVANHSLDDWDDVMAVNCDAPFILTRELGGKMIKNGYGKIVFVCSVLSFQGGITVPGYAASKGAVAQQVKAFSNEWANNGVNVNGIAPGYIVTDNTAALQADPERERALMQRIPVNRWGKAEEIGGPVVFLCSDLASFVHGTILVADGGWLSR